MSASGIKGEELERLVDRHIILSQLFVAPMSPGLRAPPRLVVAVSEEASTAERLADLADLALAAYEGGGYAEDPLILSLKSALLDAIREAATAEAELGFDAFFRSSAGPNPGSSRNPGPV